MREYLGALQQFSRNMRLYVLYTALFAFGYAGVFMLLINLYLLRLGYGIEFVGIFGGAGLLTLALGAVPATIIGARLGSRRTLIVAMVFVIAGSALVLVSESLPPGLRPAWLLLTYITAWLGGALYIVNNPPFMMANTSPRERNHAFAVTNAVLPLAGFAGTLVAGMLPGLLAGPLQVSLDSPAPYRLALWLSVLCYLLSLLVLLLTHDQASVVPAAESEDPTSADKRTTKADAASTPHSFPYGLVAIMMLILFFRTLGESAVGGFFTVYLDTELRTPTSLIGLATALARLLAVPAALAVPLFIQRLGLARTFLISVMVISAGIVVLTLIASLPAVTIGLLCITAAGTISTTSLMLFHQQIVRPEWRTAMSGGVSIAQGISMAIVTFAGGFIIAAWGFRNFFLSSAALSLVAIALFWAYFRNSERAAAPVPEGAEVAPEPEALAVQ
jgi:MFS family permease